MAGGEELLFCGKVSGWWQVSYKYINKPIQARRIQATICMIFVLLFLALDRGREK